MVLLDITHIPEEQFSKENPTGFISPKGEKTCENEVKEEDHAQFSEEQNLFSDSDVQEKVLDGHSYREKIFSPLHSFGN